MPVYHFNVYDGRTLPDAAGRELADLDEAKREAVHLSGRCIQRFAADFWTGEEWRMEVADATGLILFTLTFFGSLAPSTLHTGAGRSD